MSLETPRKRTPPDKLASRLTIARVRSLWDYTRMPSDIIKGKIEPQRVREAEHRRRQRRARKSGVHPMNRPLK